MKLNYKRTIFVGFAFFLICAFWQAYETIVPLMLVNKFGLGQTASGVIMSLDNVLALFMLPLFGALSDKTKSKHGKRTPYILIGTIAAIIAFIGLSFADNAQLALITEKTTAPAQFQEMLWNENATINNAEYSSTYNRDVPREYSLHDYACRVVYNKDYGDCTASERNGAKKWFIELNDKSVYYYDFGEGVRAYVPQSDNAIKSNAYTNLVAAARSAYAWQATLKNPAPLIFYVVILLVLLISMAVFRSPAVALMPDVTVKPLRSQANAVINLMGTVGAIFVLLLGMIFGTGKVMNQCASFSGFIIAVCALMAIGLVLFMTLVKEPKWSEDMKKQSDELGLDTESDEIEDLVDADARKNATDEGMKELRKKDRAKFVSLLLLMASVALWFTGYNAISSKYSLYATNILHKDFNMTLLVAQATAIVSYIPVGALAGKIGRKRSILIGVVMLASVFFIAAFFTSETPLIMINCVFAFAGIAWATINVNSFPMVVELAKGGDVGKYTGYYYTASMSAQIITPILSGAIMDAVGSMKPLFFYGGTFVAIAFLTMLFVRHGDIKLPGNKLKIAESAALENSVLNDTEGEEISGTEKVGRADTESAKLAGKVAEKIISKEKKRHKDSDD